MQEYFKLLVISLKLITTLSTLKNLILKQIKITFCGMFHTLIFHVYHFFVLNIMALMHSLFPASQKENFTVRPDSLRGVEWVHGLFLFPLVLGKM